MGEHSSQSPATSTMDLECADIYNCRHFATIRLRAACSIIHAGGFDRSRREIREVGVLAHSYSHHQFTTPRLQWKTEPWDPWVFKRHEVDINPQISMDRHSCVWELQRTRGVEPRLDRDAGVARALSIECQFGLDRSANSY